MKLWLKFNENIVDLDMIYNDEEADEGDSELVSRLEVLYH